METEIRYEAHYVPKGTEKTVVEIASGAFVASMPDYKGETIYEDSTEQALSIAKSLAVEKDMVLVSLKQIKEMVVFEATPESVTIIEKY